MARITTLEERLLINELAEAGYSHGEIAEHTGWSYSTVRKWLRRGRQGREHLESTMGRPAQGVLSSYPARVRRTIRAWREAHPGWGAKTLRHELLENDSFLPKEVPSQPRIARFLRVEGFTRRYEPHRQLPDSSRREATAPHIEWEMDAKGHQIIPDIGVTAFIHLNDRFSHSRLAAYPCFLGSR